VQPGYAGSVTYRPHLLLSFGGQFFGTEQWTNNLRMILGDPATTLISESAMDTWAVENIEDVAADLAAWVGRTDSRISAAARLDWVKLNVIDEDGRYWSDTETNRYDFPSGEQVSGATTETFPQVSVVLSLLTDAARGRGSRGRIYPPTGAMAMDPDTGRISSANVTAMANSALTLLNDLANEPGVDLQSPRVVVASELGTPGPMRNVTSVAVGNVADTQRRRRNALPEAYTAAGPVVIV
jgi:hypothetical protein